MKTTQHIILVVMIISTTLPGFSQDTKTTSKTEENKSEVTIEKSGRGAGLRKLTNNAQLGY
jgi:hypothetical protein